MKTEQPTLITSIEAAAAIAKNLFVGFDGNLCAAGAKALGVSNADTASGAMLPVAIEGIMLVLSGAAVTAGAAVASDSAAKAVPAAPLAAAAPAITVDDSKLSSADPTIAVDDTKLTLDSGETPVTSAAANGAIISAASGFLTPTAGAITAASGFLTPAAPALSGATPPVAVNGYALDEALGANELIRIKLV